jgi:hypothetical protein
MFSLTATAPHSDSTNFYRFGAPNASVYVRSSPDSDHEFNVVAAWQGAKALNRFAIVEAWRSF